LVSGHVTPLNLNKYESAVDAELTAVTREFDARVCPKVRACDVIPTKDKAVKPEDIRSWIASHFDYVVVDHLSMPLFAVEVDGPQHRTDPKVIERDSRKNAICRRAEFPLLRVDGEALKSIGEMTLLAYFVNIWFYGSEHDKLVIAGELPEDEPFIPGSLLKPVYRQGGVWVDVPGQTVQEQADFVEKHPDQIRYASWDPFVQAHERIRREANDGSILESGIEKLIAEDSDDNLHSLATIRVDVRRWIVGRARVRIPRFHHLHPYEIAEDLAVLDAAHKVERYLNGEILALDDQAVTTLRHELSALQSKTR
jgi:Protein of unknown function (DUF2726)